MGAVRNIVSTVGIEDQTAAMGDLSRDELVAQWEERFGHPPPLGVRKGLLVLAAAWTSQEKHFGGLSAEVKRLLKDGMKAKATAENEVGSAVTTETGSLVIETVANPNAVSRRGDQQKQNAPSPNRSARVLRPGDRLLREWNGKTHVVEVIDKGFVFDGQLFRSLTAIALQITGAHWSGPRFFGL